MDDASFSNLFIIAEKLGRTVEELLHGTEYFKPLSNAEYEGWIALESIKADQRELAKNKAQSKRTGKPVRSNSLSRRKARR